MMRFLDFSSWQGVLTTILGLAVFTLIGVGIRVLMMLTIQQRQQRMNRQIKPAEAVPVARALSERNRRVRDAAERARSDIILLGAEDQVRLAAQAATDMAAGEPIETAGLVASLRDCIRRALDLGPYPPTWPFRCRA